MTRGRISAELRDLEPDLEPWARQPWEDARHFHAFAVYRDLGPTRSLRALAGELGLRDHRHLAEWSRLHRWQERVSAYEGHADRERLESRRVALEAAEEGQRRELARIRDALSVPVRTFLERLSDPDVLKGLPLAEHASLVVQIGRAMPRIAQAERLVYGQSTANVGGHDGGPARAGGAIPPGAVRAAAEKTAEELEAMLAEAFDAGTKPEGAET